MQLSRSPAQRSALQRTAGPYILALSRKLAGGDRAGPQAAVDRRVVFSRPHLPPLPEQVKNLGRQHHLAVLATLRLHDADDLLLAVDIACPEPYHLSSPQP